MVEVTQQEEEQPYLEQLEEVIDANLKTSLKSLHDAGYVDFEENKIMIESNPGMSMEDIMACIDESKKEYDATNLEDLEGEQSSDAAAGELDERDIEEMNNLVGPLLESNTDTDPEIEQAAEEEEVKEEVNAAKINSEEVKEFGGSPVDLNIKESKTTKTETK